MAVITRRGAGLSIRGTRALAVALFVIALVALAALRDGSEGSRLPAPEAERAALHDARVRTALAGGFTRVRAMALDERTMRVSFFDGPRTVAEAAVRPDGRVQAVILHDRRHARVGSDVGQTAPVLIALVALFLVATLRLPLMRRENLDALALAAVAVPIVLLNERFLEWSVLAAGMLLAYLGWRCLAVAAGRTRGHPPGRPVMDTLPPRATALIAGSAALALALLSIPGGLVSDVGFASLAGATTVLDGSLPYGNLAFGELVHGDTYPLLAYLAYVPAALASPVHDGFDGLEGALYVATAFALLGALALGRLGGSRLAVAFVAFPPVMIAASSGSSDVVAAAFVAGALALGARAGGSTAALAVAGWVKLGPLALIPLWVARYRDRGVAGAVAGAAAVTAVLAAAVVALGGLGGFADMAHALSFQSKRGSPMSVWGLLNLPAAQIAFQAAVLTGIALAAVQVWRDRALAADPRRMAALAAAVLLGVQLAANHWSATYLAWVFPLVAVALLAGSERDPDRSHPRSVTPSRPRAPASWRREAHR